MASQDEQPGKPRAQARQLQSLCQGMPEMQLPGHHKACVMPVMGTLPSL